MANLNKTQTSRMRTLNVLFVLFKPFLFFSNYFKVMRSIFFVYKKNLPFVFQKALNLHICVFGGNNLLVARCHEDLACTSYSYGYNSGHFKDALYVKMLWNYFTMN